MVKRILVVPTEQNIMNVLNEITVKGASVRSYQRFKPE